MASTKAAPATPSWVGLKCGIVTPYELVDSTSLSTDEEYNQGDETDCLECENPICQAVCKRNKD